MYRVLLADDEPLMRAGIRSSILWQNFGMEIVGEASNGKETMELIQLHTPHVLLLDIHMPAPDGLELLRQLKKEAHPPHVIVISNADDFDTVHQAMKLGAYDYLRKATFRSTELQALLVALRHDMEQQGVVDMPRLQIQEENAKAFRRLLLEENDETFIKQFETRFPTNGYTLCCFAISKRDAAGIDRVYSFFLQERAEFASVQTFRSRDNQILAVVSHTQDTEWIDRYVNVMIAGVKSCLNLQCNVSISRVEQSYAYLKQLYRETLLCNEAWFYLKPPKIVHYDENIAQFLSDQKEEALELLLQEMQRAIEYYSLDQLSHTAKEIFTYFHRHHTVLPKIVKNDFINIVNQCTNVLRGLEFTSADIDRLFAYTDITEKADVFELEAWMMEFLDKYKNMVIHASDDVVRNAAVMKSVRYIEEHFAEHITLAEIAASANLSVNYFSTLFKRITGVCVIEYLNQKRIDVAKECLARQKDCRVGEIAYQVGFESVTYFSKMFKQLVGITAAEYKKVGSSQEQ